MQIVYNLEEPPDSFRKSLFLIGPTPRSSNVKSRRPETLELLERKNYDGVVFVPENRPGSKIDAKYDDNTDGYARWEHYAMGKSDLILCCIQRNLTLDPESVSKIMGIFGTEPELAQAKLSDYKPELKLPAYTSNVEFGFFAHSGKLLFAPIHGDKNKYLSFIAEKMHIPQFYTIEGMINEVVFEMLKEGALRTGGEREIPLFIWKHRAFQNWYRALKSAGNRLDGASVQWLSRVRNKPQAIFAFAIKPNIFVASENRNKLNDPVIFRLDISSVVLYKKRPNLLDSEIVLIREFRNAVSNKDGFVWELPGGSSPFITDPLAVAVEETKEEVGLEISPDRLRHIGSRQMASTLATYKSHAYSAELTEEELARLKSQKDTPHGSDYPNNPTGERAYTEVLTLREILAKDLVDWSNCGMILYDFIGNEEKGE